MKGINKGDINKIGKLLEMGGMNLPLKARKLKTNKKHHKQHQRKRNRKAFSKNLSKNNDKIDISKKNTDDQE